MNNTNEKRILSMLSLAKKAGKIITGEDGCVKAIQKDNAKLVLVATDASDNTKKKFNDKTKFYNVPIHSIFTKEMVSANIGLQNRATIVITDEGFGSKIEDLIVKGWTNGEETH
ncbi:MAG: ribosomal L7Ae/L30e/S12e/Gadd45 family protein [Defluviitaleaceae bacterium]|nr:ribosomal L7Ae/L30e/S12e/Gadd45 family protein [Defluviitaleaceae bacterium]